MPPTFETWWSLARWRSRQLICTLSYCGRPAPDFISCMDVAVEVVILYYSRLDSTRCTSTSWRIFAWRTLKTRGQVQRKFPLFSLS